ncbi:hypothetical protein Ahy_B04g070242 isoform B [Arachis hypogaea]|uniref:Protein kinase domain-containing protein n=1 Tax=Arachis hypogaea TaxID=3818 RepID=A0A444ZFU4_ARAHY|nr:hypothetical protein Ahy_B04g070242 isoform B [Arachis hypogaea]
MLPRESFSSEGVDDASSPPGRNSNHLCVHAAPPRLATDSCTPLSAIIPVFSNWPHVANFGLAKTLQCEVGDRGAGAGAGAMSRVAGSYEYIAPSKFFGRLLDIIQIE